MQDVSTLINGAVYSAKSCAFYVDMVPRKGFTAVNYKEAIESEMVYDDSKDGTPVGETYGRYGVSAFSWTILLARWLELEPLIAAKGLGSLGAARFGFQAVYSEPIHIGPPRVDTLFNCRVVSREQDYQEDIKALVMKVELKATHMVSNGITLYDPKRALSL